LKKSKNEPLLIESNDRGFTKAYGSYIVVFASPDQKHWDVLGTIIHESVHVFQEAMKYVCEEGSGDEAQAYNIEQIAINLLKDYDALAKKRSS
jgi:hypothetical protein